MQNGNSKLIIIGIVLLILIIGGYLFIQGNQTQIKTDTLDDLMMQEETIKDGVENNSMAKMIMNDIDSLTGQLEDVSGGNSSGTAYLLRKNGVLYHHVEAKLPESNTGSVYEGWLVSKTPSLKFFSTGIMEQVDDIFTLTYTTESDNLGFNDVVITLETKVDTTPEEHILEGIVK